MKPCQRDASHEHGATCTKMREKWSGAQPEEERSAVVSSQADSCQLETKPECTPRRCPNMTSSGVHGKGMVPNVRFSKNMRTVSEQAGRYQRNERASRLFDLLLAPQGKALLDDLDPCCWRMSCKLVVEDFQDAILLSNNLLDCPPLRVRSPPHFF